MGLIACRRWKSALDGLDVLDPSSVCEEEMTMGDSLHARTERLSRHTREHVHDVSAWLQYTVHQQDVLLMSGWLHFNSVSSQNSLEVDLTSTCTENSSDTFVSLCGMAVQ